MGIGFALQLGLVSVCLCAGGREGVWIILFYFPCVGGWVLARGGGDGRAL